MTEENVEVQETVEPSEPTVESLQEQLSKYDGVDMELYNKAKDFDFESAQKSQKLSETVSSNPEIAALIERMQNGPKEKEDNSIEAQVKSLNERMDNISAREQEMIDSENKDKFLNGVNSALDGLTDKMKFAKSEGYDERQMIIDRVIDRFIESDAEAEAKGLKEGKLNWDNIAEVAAEEAQKLQNYKRQLLGLEVRRDKAPSTTPSGDSGQKGSAPQDMRGRVGSMASELKGINAGAKEF